MKKLMRNVLRVLPDEGRSIKIALRTLHVHKELAAAKLIQGVTGIKLPDPRVVYWIDPRKIEYHTVLENKSPDWEDWVFPQNKNLKPIQNGNWDVLSHRVDEMRIFRAINDRIWRGESWQSSDYYKVAVHQIENGRNVWRCTDRADFDKRCAKTDQLIESITKDGYLDRPALGNMSGIDTLLGQNEILINISRDGFALFQDGRHRLAIACALGLKKVPVQIFVRHSEWQVFRQYMHRLACGSGGASRKGFLYQKPAHYDFSDISAMHGCEDRWSEIKKHVPAGPGMAVDIGCNLGYFCHELEDLGYSCFGIEYLPDVAYSAKKIAVSEKRNLKILIGDALAKETFDGIDTSDISIVMALNIFHHFIKTESGYARLREFMKRIRINTMFFEPHCQDDPQMQGVFSNPSPEDFVSMIRSWGNFQSVVPIYLADDGRIVYKLSR
jgi:SAM-dependent methyltransferase